MHPIKPQIPMNTLIFFVITTTQDIAANNIDNINSNVGIHLQYFLIKCINLSITKNFYTEVLYQLYFLITKYLQPELYLD